jgi:predicted membrane-bound spermidine synthase
MVSPYVVRLKIRNVEASGRTVGDLYAISTVGSIAGTFVAGFFLILYFDLNSILLGLSAVLFLTSLWISPKISKLVLMIFILAWVSALSSSVGNTRRESDRGITVFNTLYESVKVMDLTFEGRPVRYLQTDPFGIQSGRYLDSDDLLFEYAKYYRLAGCFNPSLSRTLMIGGAGYSYPMDYLKYFPEATMDVVELDPGITEIAGDFFGLKEDPRLSIIHQDGRIFLERSDREYDVIMIDAFKALSAPFHLTTREAINAMKERLSDDGIVMTNIISSGVSGDRKLLESEFATYKSVFPVVYLLPVGGWRDDGSTQNVMLVAVNDPAKKFPESEDAELGGYLKQAVSELPGSEKAPIFTDQFAPGDLYAASSVY